MILLDTNVISEVMKSVPEPSVMDWLRRQPLHTLAISSVTLAEIRYGLARVPDGKRKFELERRFQVFVERGFGERVMDFDSAAADIYGELVVRREKSGTPMDSFDAMIVATAKSRGARIATRDVGGFEDCGIEIVNPWKA